MSSITCRSFSPRDAIKSTHRREKQFVEEFAVFGGTPENAPLITLRVYASDAQTFVCLWVRGKSATGSAVADGYGYHRASSAAHWAFHAAGFNLGGDIAAGGDEAITEALLACASFLGAAKPWVHCAHG